MSDTFAFQTLPVPLYRRVNVRVVKAVLACCVVVLAVGSFARWTMRSEQASFTAAARHAEASGAAPAAETDPSNVGVLTSGITAISVADQDTQAAMLRTLTRARHLQIVRGSLGDAGPGQLTQGSRGIIFTDGPSIASGIVSVSGTDTGWGAAVMSDSGVCFAARLDPRGVARFGTVAPSCTGAAALQVTDASW